MTIKYSKQTPVLVIEGEQRGKVKESFIKAEGNRPDAGTNSAEANEIEKESDLVMLHRRIDDLETNLKGRISNIVVELSAIYLINIILSPPGNIIHCSLNKMST